MLKNRESHGTALLPDSSAQIAWSRLYAKHSTIVSHVLAILGYTLVTIIVTYPTALRLTTHIPGSGDAPWYVWDLWWFKHALLNLHQSPLTTDLLFYPVGNAPMQWQTPYNEFFMIPLQAVLGPVLLYNLLFLATFILSGYFMYLLVLTCVKRRDLAFVGGLIFAFCSYREVRGLQHLSLLTTQFLPLALLLLIGCLRRPTILHGVAAGVGVALVALASPYYAAYFLLPVALVAAPYIIMTHRHLLRNASFWRAMGSACAVALILCAPFYISYLQTSSEMQGALKLAAQSTEAFSADLLSWVLPPGFHPFWGRFTFAVYDRFTSRIQTETTLYFGFLPAALAIASLFLKWPGRRAVRFWQAMLLTTFLLSFGPVLHVAGRAVIEWMPYRLLMAIPKFDAFRVPSRIGLDTVLAGTMLAMMVVQKCMRKFPRWRWSALLAAWSACLLFNMVFMFPYLTSSTAVPAVYEVLAKAPRPSPVLDLPFGDRYSDQTTWSMYYQTYHQQPLVSGYMARRPPRLFDPERTLPFVRRFFGWNSPKPVNVPSKAPLSDEDWPDDIRNASARVAAAGIRYVVLHCPSATGSFCAPAITLLNKGLGLPVYRDANALLYAVQSSILANTGQITGLSGTVLCNNNLPAPGGSRKDVTSPKLVPQELAFSVPLSGTWTIQGDLTGRRSANPELLIDGHPVVAQTFTYSDTLRTFEIVPQVLNAGLHSLSLASVLQTAEDTTSARPCVSNFATRLQAPATGQARASAITFANERGPQLELVSAAVVPTLSVGTAEAAPSLTLVTAWRSLGNGVEIGKPGVTPMMYVHITDANGDTKGQADHTLGERRLQAAEGSHFYDLTELPESVGSEPDMEVRVGLWFPETRAYYWVTDASKADKANRLILGTLGSLENSTDNRITTPY